MATCKYCAIEFLPTARKSTGVFCSRSCVGHYGYRVSSGRRRDRRDQTFMNNVDVRSKSECWPWKRRVNKFGYGCVSYNGKEELAHRVAFAIANGGKFPDTHACHSCDNPPCCNPAHIWDGTHRQNMDDMMAKNRRNPPVGERNRGAKLTEEDVTLIRSLQDRDATVAARYGVSPSTIRRVRTGAGWKHLPIQEATS
jgi:hypothetical protein